MIGFLLRRIAALGVTILITLTAMFAALHAAPGGPIDALGPAVAANPDARAAISAERGLDQPLPEQYLTYLGDIARGDLGNSLYDGSSVAEAIAATAPVSFELGLLATLTTLVPGAVAGLFAARSAGSLGDGAVRLVTLAAVSMPSYWLAVLCLVGLGERFPDLLPNAGGFVSFSDDPMANLRTMLLPAVIVGLAGFAMVARTVRASFVDALDQDDVRFGRATGLPEATVVRRIALRRAAIPTLAVTGLVVGGLLTGTVLVENVFQIPGLGQLMVTAFRRADYPLALGTALVTAVVLLTVNLAVDVAIRLVDPRRGLAR